MKVTIGGTWASSARPQADLPYDTLYYCTIKCKRSLHQVLAAAHAASSSRQIFLRLDAPVYLGYLWEHVTWSRVGQGQTLLILKPKMKHKICPKYGRATSYDALILKHSLVRQLKSAETELKFAEGNFMNEKCMQDSFPLYIIPGTIWHMKRD